MMHNPVHLTLRGGGRIPLVDTSALNSAPFVVWGGVGAFSWGELFQTLFGEFDPGSGRTLAACLTHASRAERPFGVLERRTGE
jgi:hypothetical protein